MSEEILKAKKSVDEIAEWLAGAKAEYTRGAHLVAITMRVEDIETLLAAISRTPSSLTKEIVEVAARALLRIEDSWNDHEWEQLPPGVQTMFRRQAQAALSVMVEADQWQPISTAPKDGTGVLVICMGAEIPAAGVGWFISGKWTTLDPESAEGFGEDFYHASTWHNPTHWRPLPEPPQAALSAISGVGR